jgi:uncharacterized protein
MAETALIDTNIFMYAAGGPHTYREPCRRIVRSLGAHDNVVGDWHAVTDAELFQEIAYRYASIGKVHVGVRLQESLRVLALRVLPIDEHVVDAFLELQRDHAADLAARRLSVRDVLHVAVMRAHCIQAILTADRDFDSIPNIRRLDPVELSEAL